MINTVYIKIAVLVLAFAVGFGSAWSWQGALKDNAHLESLQETADAASAQAAAAKAAKEARDAAYHATRVEEVAQDRIAQLAKERKTEKRIEYITKDPNARECGLSDAGVRLWNDSASGVLDTEPTGPINYGGAIAASNDRVLSAAQVSFDRHWDTIRQVHKLQNYINTQCVIRITEIPHE
jgi:hypothetical protein